MFDVCKDFFLPQDIKDKIVMVYRRIMSETCQCIANRFHETSILLHYITVSSQTFASAYALPSVVFATHIGFGNRKADRLVQNCSLWKEAKT